MTSVNCSQTSNNTTANCTNAVTDPDSCPKFLELYMTIFVVIILLVVIGNIGIIIFINPFKKQPRRPNMELLIFYLAIFDLSGSIILAVDIYDNITCFKKWLFGWLACKLVYTSFDISLNMSVCILTIMSVDRCRSIIMPLKQKFSHYVIHMAVFISFLFSVALQSNQFILWEMQDGRCIVDKSAPAFMIPHIANILLRDTVSILVFTVTSCLVYTSLANSNLIDVYRARKKKEINKVVVMLVTMEVAFVVTVIPYDLYFTAWFISRVIPGDHAIEYSDTMYHVDRVLSALQMSNCFANCFIYAKMHRLFRKHMSQSTCSSMTAMESIKDPRRNTQDGFINTSQLSVTHM